MRPILGAARSGIVTAANSECRMQNDVPPIVFQARMPKRLATIGGVSLAEVIRRSIDQTLIGLRVRSADDRRARALSVVGAFGSGKSDLARRHDEALEEASEGESIAE